jgi:class 3 adenylate cyclase
MLESLEEFNSSMSLALQLKIGVHPGHSIAVTLNERLDYFGQNVNIAARTQQLAEAGQILVSQDVLDGEGVAKLLASATLQSVSGVMKGVAEEIQVSRVTAL